MNTQYLCVNMNNDEFINILKHHIDNDLPLSFSRFGDGEIRCLTRYFPNKAQDQRFCKLWGFKWPDDLDKAIDYAKKIIVKSLYETDIIGILDKKSPVVKYLKYRPEAWSISIGMLRDLAIEKPLKICDHQITRGRSIGDIHNFKKILNGKNVHIVSCLTKKLKKNNISKLLGVNVGYTQVDFYTKLNDDSRKQLFTRLDKITETVVLIALSIIGKDVPSYLKNRGKICIDMGATLDAWAGQCSRRWFKPGGLQHYCLIT